LTGTVACQKNLAHLQWARFFVFRFYATICQGFASIDCQDKTGSKFDQQKQIFFIILSFLTIILPGCDKKLEEINIDPTKLTAQNMQFNYLFTSAELSAAGAGIFGSSFMYSSTMTQQLSSTSTYDFFGDKYIYDEGNKLRAKIEQDALSDML